MTTDKFPSLKTFIIFTQKRLKRISGKRKKKKKKKQEVRTDLAAVGLGT